MEKPVVVKKEKLKSNTSKNSQLTAFDAKESARKAERLQKTKNSKLTEFIEIGE